MPECRLAVLGLSKRSQGQRENGVGKSSLCFRFTHLSQKEYSEHGEDHSSLVSLAEFDEAELNNDHFVYFGKARRDYLPSGSDSRLPLTVHVIEQTEFTNNEASDSVYRPLGRAPAYVERATIDKLHSPGKVAYYSRSMIGQRQHGPETFPTDFGSRGLDGYLFVLDPTCSAGRRQEQMELLDECLDRLDKKPIAVVVTKCDLLSREIHDSMQNGDFDLVQFFQTDSPRAKQSFGTMSDKKATLTRVRKHLRSSQSAPGRLEFKQKKIVVPYFCASSRRDIGVDLPFLYLAHKALRLAGSAPKHVTYPKLVDKRKALRVSLQSAVKTLLKNHVEHKAMTWAQKRQELSQNRDFHHYEDIFGEDKLKELFCARLIEIAISVKHEQAETSLVEESMPSPMRRRLQNVRRKKQISREVQSQQSYTRDQSEWAAKKDALEELVENHPDLKMLVKNPKRFKRSIRKYRDLATADPIEQEATKTEPAATAIYQRSCQTLPEHPELNLSEQNVINPDLSTSVTTTDSNEDFSDGECLEKSESSCSVSEASDSSKDLDDHHYVTIENIRGQLHDDSPIKSRLASKVEDTRESEEPAYQTISNVSSSDTGTAGAGTPKLQKAREFDIYTTGRYTSFDQADKSIMGSVNPCQSEEKNIVGLPIFEDDSLDIDSPLTLSGLVNPVSMFGSRDYFSQLHSNLSPLEKIHQPHTGNWKSVGGEGETKDGIVEDSESDNDGGGCQGDEDIYTTIKECFLDFSSAIHRPRQGWKEQPTVDVDLQRGSITTENTDSPLSLAEPTSSPMPEERRSDLPLEHSDNGGMERKTSNDSCIYGDDTDAAGYVSITQNRDDDDDADTFGSNCHSMAVSENTLPAEYITIIPPEGRSCPKESSQFTDERATDKSCSGVQVKETKQRHKLQSKSPTTSSIPPNQHQPTDIMTSDDTTKYSVHVYDNIRTSLASGNEGVSEPIYESVYPNSVQNLAHSQIPPVELGQSNSFTKISPAIRESSQSSMGSDLTFQKHAVGQKSSNSPATPNRASHPVLSLKNPPSPGSPRSLGSPEGTPRRQRKFATHRRVRHSTSDDVQQ